MNTQVSDAARVAGALVVRADDAAESDVLWGAVTRVGPVEVSVGTGGVAPALSAWVSTQLDRDLEAVLGADAATLSALGDVLAEVREEWRGRVGIDPAACSRTPDWRSTIDRSMLEMISRGRTAEAKERLQACRSSS